MRTKRVEFTDRQKAEIFVRDRALCCYTGKSLWLIDYGGGPAMPPWIEHITPASKGGAATLGNGVLACWYHNHIQSDRGEPILLFQDGLPNWLAFEIFEEIPEHFYLHFERFAALHWSDWFINQAVFHLRLAAGQETERRKDGKEWVRGRTYRCAAAFKTLQRARVAAERESVPSLAERGLLPTDPTVDQALLIRAINATNVEQLERIALDLVPYMKASYAALQGFAQIDEQGDPIAAARQHRDRVEQDRYVVPKTKRLIVSHIDRITAIYHRLAASQAAAAS